MYILIGTSLLYQRNIFSKENIELYRDDGLRIVKIMSSTEVERKKKYLVGVFERTGLSITVKTNLKVAAFLDLLFGSSIYG